MRRLCRFADHCCFDRARRTGRWLWHAARGHAHRRQEHALRGPDGALRRVAELPAAEARRRGARLLRRRDGRAAARARRLRQPPGRHRPDGWPIPQQVDYHIVRAEMNGLDFDHRVLKPWANNPAFYVTVFTDESDQPAREGPFAAGGVELWTYTFPLSARDAARDRRRTAADPDAPRTGEDQPDRQPEGPLDLRREGASRRRARTSRRSPRSSVTRSRRSRRRRSSRRADGDRRASPPGSRPRRRREDRAVGHRRRELRLVSEERPARAVHLAGRGHADGARAGALVALPRPRGAAATRRCRRRCRSRAPMSTTSASTPR